MHLKFYNNVSLPLKHFICPGALRRIGVTAKKLYTKAFNLSSLLAIMNIVYLTSGISN